MPNSFLASQSKIGKMQIAEIIRVLEDWAPLVYQESYDNSKLLFGQKDRELNQVLVSLDVTEAIVDEALRKGAQMIISHHPLIFGGLKSLTGKNDAERALIKAIQNNIAIYALHTNLDNVASGVNAEIGRRLGIDSPRILAPRDGILKKLVVFVPHDSVRSLSEALWAAGAGNIGNYDQCSFRSEGKGTFRASANANPTKGDVGSLHEEAEFRLELLVEEAKLAAVLNAMQLNHPYEEVAYEIYAIENAHQEIGSGMYGDLPKAIPSEQLLKQIKQTFGGVVRYTRPQKEEIKRIAWCGGSGSFLLSRAEAIGADLFLSSDFKYHQFFEADNQILIADIGHYENEQYTIGLIAEYLRKKFPNFAVLLTENSTNPINYL